MIVFDLQRLTVVTLSLVGLICVFLEVLRNGCTVMVVISSVDYQIKHSMIILWLFVGVGKIVINFPMLSGYIVTRAIDIIIVITP